MQKIIWVVGIMLGTALLVLGYISIEQSRAKNRYDEGVWDEYQVLNDLEKIEYVKTLLRSPDRRKVSVVLEVENEPTRLVAILELLCEINHGLKPVSTECSRKIFNLTKHEVLSSESLCYYIGKFAALTGDVELLRKMVCTYFGSAEGEIKGTYVEEFMNLNPELFFSLPDTYQIWSHAGGADWCCDKPEQTIPLVVHYAGSTVDAHNMLQDLKIAIKANQGTDWAKEAAGFLPTGH